MSLTKGKQYLLFDMSFYEIEMFHTFSNKTFHYNVNLFIYFNLNNYYLNLCYICIEKIVKSIRRRRMKRKLIYIFCSIRLEAFYEYSWYNFSII